MESKSGENFLSLQCKDSAYELLSLQAKIIRPPPSPLSLRCKDRKFSSNFDSIPKVMLVHVYSIEKGLLYRYYWVRITPISAPPRLTWSGLGTQNTLPGPGYFLRL